MVKIKLFPKWKIYETYLDKEKELFFLIRRNKIKKSISLNSFLFLYYEKNDLFLILDTKINKIFIFITLEPGKDIILSYFLLNAINKGIFNKSLRMILGNYLISDNNDKLFFSPEDIMLKNFKETYLLPEIKDVIPIEDSFNYKLILTNKNEENSLGKSFIDLGEKEENPEGKEIKLLRRKIKFLSNSNFYLKKLLLDEDLLWSTLKDILYKEIKHIDNNIFREETRSYYFIKKIFVSFGCEYLEEILSPLMNKKLVHEEIIIYLSKIMENILNITIPKEIYSIFLVLRDFFYSKKSDVENYFYSIKVLFFTRFIFVSILSPNIFCLYIERNEEILTMITKLFNLIIFGKEDVKIYKDFIEKNKYYFDDFLLLNNIPKF